MNRKALLSALLIALVAPVVVAQQTRPIPYPVFNTPALQRALDRGTRSPDGAPGPEYWTNTAEYVIDAVLSPTTNMLRGSETVTYHNNSPDTLRQLVVNLYQNLHSEGVVRTRPVQITGGVKLSRVSMNGQNLVEGRQQGFFFGPGPRPDVKLQYSIRGTKLSIDVPQGIPPGTQTKLGFSWSFEVPEVGAPRMGQDGEVYYVAYWYPQMAVYDDVDGWDNDAYQGSGEFYMGYADYEASITVPEGWLIGATGVLLNPNDVLTPTVQGRLATAARSEEVVRVVTQEERQAGVSTVDSPSGTLTWKFKANNVRDFAFGTSDKYLWDATYATVGDLNGDGSEETSMIHAFYRPDAQSWDKAAELSKFSIESLSSNIMPYPYPHMTAVQGIIGGGMEFPMITLIGGMRNEARLFGVTYHELGHMWFPMLVGQNEKAFTWMDEGLTSFNTAEGGTEFYSKDQWAVERRSYLSIVGTGFEEPSMRHADTYRNQWGRGTAAYAKPAAVMHALRGMVGNELFYKALREYAHRWTNKHPLPWDLFNTFEDVLGMDLDWFWTSWLFETWSLDQAVSSVETAPDGSIEVIVQDLGLTPMPAPVRVTYDDGRTVDQIVPVDHWLDNNRVARMSFPAGTVSRVEIDADGYYPDANRTNGIWTASGDSTE
jgi:hypothetical protein